MKRKMPFRIIICITVLLISSVLAYANNQTFDENRALELFQEEAAQQGFQVQKEKSAFRKWEHGPTADLYVGVAASRSLSNDYLVFIIGVFKLAATGPILVNAIADEFEGIDMPWDYSISLDFAPYRLNARETAFGVRFRNHYQSSARGAVSETLYLYRFWEEHLDPILLWEDHLDSIFNVMTEEEGGDIDGKNDFSHHRIIIMSTKKHNGFFDLVVKDKKTKKTHYYCWNGSSYTNCKPD